MLIGAPDRSGGALGEICPQAIRDAENVQDLPDSRHVVAIGVAEDDDVIRIERDARTGMPRREALEEPEINRMKKHGVEDVDDDSE